MTDRLLNRRELCQKLAITLEWSYRNLPGLIEGQGFPRPRLPRRWSEKAVDAWIAGNQAVGTLCDDDGGLAARRDARSQRLQAMA